MRTDKVGRVSERASENERMHKYTRMHTDAYGCTRTYLRRVRVAELPRGDVGKGLDLAHVRCEPTQVERRTEPTLKIRMQAYACARVADTKMRARIKRIACTCMLRMGELERPHPFAGS